MLLYSKPNKQPKFRIQNIIQKLKQKQYLCMTATPYRTQECLAQANTWEGMVFVSWQPAGNAACLGPPSLEGIPCYSYTTLHFISAAVLDHDVKKNYSPSLHFQLFFFFFPLHGTFPTKPLTRVEESPSSRPTWLFLFLAHRQGHSPTETHSPCG